MSYEWRNPAAENDNPYALKSLLQRAGLWDGFTNEQYAYDGEGNQSTTGTTDWGRLNGYQLGSTLQDGTHMSALRDPSGNVVASESFADDPIGLNDVLRGAAFVGTAAMGMNSLLGNPGLMGAGELSGMDLAGDAVLGSGNNITTAGGLLGGSSPAFDAGAYLGGGIESGGVSMPTLDPVPAAPTVDPYGPLSGYGGDTLSAMGQTSALDSLKGFAGSAVDWAKANPMLARGLFAGGGALMGLLGGGSSGGGGGYSYNGPIPEVNSAGKFSASVKPKLSTVPANLLELKTTGPKQANSGLHRFGLLGG